MVVGLLVIHDHGTADAVVALPLRAALMVPAVKFPEASRWTIILAVLRFVASDMDAELRVCQVLSPR